MCKHTRGSQYCFHIVLKGSMFELQPCHYYEGFSQWVCIQMGKSKLKEVKCQKKIQKRIEMIFKLYEICSIY